MTRERVGRGVGCAGREGGRSWRHSRLRSKRPRALKDAECRDGR
jgi:hypothetical protein